MNGRKWLIAGSMMLLMAVAGAMPVLAQEGEGEEAAMEEGDGLLNGALGDLRLEAGLDWTTQYLFRGIYQEDDGLILQPWVEAGLPVYKGNEGDLIEGVEGVLGWWNSLHWEQTGTDDDGPSTWYQTNLSAGISSAVKGGYTVDAIYTARVSPNSAFDTVQDITLGISYDDAHCWEGVLDLPGFKGLQPHVAAFFETRNAADGGESGIGFEVGINPGFTPLPDGGLKDLTVSIPVTVGLSIDEYYEGVRGDDSDWGYVDVGIVFGHPIGPDIDLSAGVHFVFVGETAEEFNDDNDRGFEIIGAVGVTARF